MRALFTLLHRWAGLFIALFLIISGVTGAVISWDHELDEWLNSHLTDATFSGDTLPPLQLAEKIEADNPNVQVTFIPLAIEPGHSLAFGVDGRVDAATGKLIEPGFNQIFMHPTTGEVLGKREWGSVWPITQENFISFLYVLHYSLHIPEFWGIDHWGVWLMGVIALIWTVDCFSGFYLTLPRNQKARTQTIHKLAQAETQPRANKGWWQRWKPAWKVRWSGGSYKVNFDLHRAGSLWTWSLLFIVAFTAFSLNLYREVFFPVMSAVSNVTPSPFDLRTPTDENKPITPKLSYAQALDQANSTAKQYGWQQPAGSIFYSRSFGIYGVQFFFPEDGHGSGGVGHRALYLDGQNGEILGDREPWKGTAADIFVQAQFPLHSGRILGLPGRILISLMGLVVAMLSVTGIVIWLRKRRSRLASRYQREQKLA